MHSLRVSAACCLTLSLAIPLASGAAAQPATEIPLVAGLKVTLAVVNGTRVELPAIRATGQLKYGDIIRPWEYLLLDHPELPLTLHFTNGSVGAPIPFTPETTRAIVRIDFPTRDGHREGAQRGVPRRGSGHLL